MSELTTIPVSQLLIMDAPTTPGDLSDLEADIKERGIQRPLLVSDTFQVLDGVRRLRAAVALGIEEVPCVVTSDMAEIIPLIAEATADESGFRSSWAERREDGFIRYRRLGAYGKRKLAEVKGAMGGQGKGRFAISGPVYTWSRELLTAMRLSTSEINLWSVVRAQVERDLPEDRGFLANLKEDLVAGMPATRGLRTFMAYYKDGLVIKPSEQIETINSSLNALAGSVAAIESLGQLSNKISQEQLDTWRDTMAQLRIRLGNFAYRIGAVTTAHRNKGPETRRVKSDV